MRRTFLVGILTTICVALLVAPSALAARPSVTITGVTMTGVTPSQAGFCSFSLAYTYSYTGHAPPKGSVVAWALRSGSSPPGTPTGLGVGDIPLGNTISASFNSSMLSNGAYFLEFLVARKGGTIMSIVDTSSFTYSSSSCWSLGTLATYPVT